MATAAPSTLNVREYLPKGMNFVRTVKAMAAGKYDQQVNFAVRHYGADSIPAQIVKASVAGLSRLAEDELARWNATAAEFFEAVRPMTIVGKIQGLRRVPLNVRLISATTGVTAYWVGEGAPAPVSVATYAEGSLDPCKVVALTIATQELLDSSDPAAEQALRNDLLAANAEAIDRTFIDPTNGGSAGVKPASVTYGLTPIASTGDADDDIAKLLAAFSGNLAQAVFVGSPLTFATMNSFSRPKIGALGGQIAGIPAIASESANDNLALLDASAIALGEGFADLSVSREATIQMADDPTNDVSTPTATTQTSLWQTDSVGIMSSHQIAWERIRAGAALVTNIAYVAGVS
jgi:capsid protein